MQQGAAGNVTTPGGEVEVNIPANALPDLSGAVDVEVKSLEVDFVPAPPADATFVRAVEVNSLVDGSVTPISYDEPVELVFMLTPEDIALVDGDTDRLGVLWFNPETEEWVSLVVEYEAEPAPSGRLIAMLDHFSLYTLGVLEDVGNGEAPQSQQAQATPTPVPTPLPTPSPAPTAVPTTTAFISQTQAEPQSQPASTAVIVAQAATATPAPTATPRPAATASPVPQALSVPAAPAPAVTAAPQPESPPVVEPEDGGGLSASTIVVIAIVVIAIIAGGFGVAQTVLARRRGA